MKGLDTSGGVPLQGLVGGVEGDIGDDAEEAHALALDADEGADPDVLHGCAGVELDLDALGQASRRRPFRACRRSRR